MNDFEKNNHNIIKFKTTALKDYLQKITLELDANVLEFIYIVENYINILEPKENRQVIHLHNKSKTLANNVKDLIHVMKIGNTILNSILDDLE